MTGPERTSAHRARRRRRIRKLVIDVSQDDLREIAKAGYEGAASTDCDCQSQAIALFVSGAPVALVATGNAVTMLRRNSKTLAALFTPLLNVYRVGLFPIAKPTAIVLNWWLGPEGITFLRERDFRALITKHAGVAGADVGQLEAIGALNFLDLDDILVMDEGELVDPRSVIALPFEKQRPLLPKFERSPDDPFLRRLNASGKKWVIIVDTSNRLQVIRRRRGGQRRSWRLENLTSLCEPYHNRKTRIVEHARSRPSLE